MAPDTPDPAPEAPAARGALTGKAALITGAARRVGASIARVLHAAGAEVVLHYRSSADDAAALMRELNAVLTPESLVVSDASYSAIWAANYLSVQRSGMRFLAGRGLAGLGWGLPAALGVKEGSPARRNHTRKGALS